MQGTRRDEMLSLLLLILLLRRMNAETVHKIQIRLGKRDYHRWLGASSAVLESGSGCEGRIGGGWRLTSGVASMKVWIRGVKSTP